ncbi:glycosyltransferase family 2 protein [Algoriphagus aquimarinus]|uniref:glycosyltransferase family 2 protein n=1 Tax=Algoriphagus aquimarinus TaxID=237018 RepID=UPI0030DB0590|tara:strand:- start:28154 stop:29086 length:933 start_codon:yes stop_codon:yes gene_type:complete
MSSSSFPSVAIVLINWKNYEDSKKCLISLQGCNYPNFKSIIIDNHSGDGSGEKLQKEFGDFAHFIFTDENLGFSGGNNVGFRYALEQNFDYIMELNNDTEVEPDFLDKLVFSIHDKPEFGIAQPLIFYNGERRNVIWNAGGKLIPSLGLSLTKKEGSTDLSEVISEETAWTTGCATLIKTKVLRETGLLKEFFFFGSFEDVDLSMRVREKGYKLWFESESRIYHSVGNSSKSKTKGKEGFLNPMVHYLAQRNQMIFIKHHTENIFIPLAVAVQFGKMLLYSVYFIGRWRLQKLRMAWKGFADGLIKTYHD